MSGHTVRKQANRTLRCMQAWVRVQARVRARRIHMSEEAVLQRQMWQRIKQQEFLLVNKTNASIFNAIPMIFVIVMALLIPP